jgi:uncharacterized surface protein with fasciclin (FAS1) repeats
MKRIDGISKIVLVGLVSLSSVAVLSACNQNAPEANVSQPPVAEAPEAAPVNSPAVTVSPDAAASGTIVKLASTNDSFKTFTKAVEAADLTETLSAQGPYTVFAPTDTAFEALPDGVVDDLLKPENKDQLVQLLTYHVVPGEVSSSQIKPGEVGTVQGTPVNVQVDSASSAVKVNDATVTQPDIEASNGVIHAVDKVIMPPQT